jgi:hypothetical protein
MTILVKYLVMVISYLPWAAANIIAVRRNCVKLTAVWHT